MLLSSAIFAASFPNIKALLPPNDAIFKARFPTLDTWSNTVYPQTFESTELPIPHSTHPEGEVPQQTGPTPLNPAGQGV